MEKAYQLYFRSFAWALGLTIVMSLIGCFEKKTTSQVKDALSGGTSGNETAKLAQLTMLGAGVFGSVNVGSYQDVVFTLNNVGESSATSLTVDNLAAPYAIQSNNCGSTLEVGASCQIQIRFTPTGAFTETRSWAIHYNNSQLNVNLSADFAGVGVLALTQVQANFSTAVLSDAGALEIENSGNEISLAWVQEQKCSSDLGGWGASYGLNNSATSAMDTTFADYTPTTSDVITQVSLYLSRWGTAAGNISLTVQSENSGLPSGTILANSVEHLDSSAVSTMGAYYTFNLTTPLAVVAGVKYFFVLVGDAGFSTTGSAVIRINYSSANYSWEQCNNQRFGTTRGHMVNYGGYYFDIGGAPLLKVTTQTASSYAAYGPSVVMVFDGGSVGVDWNLASFQATENPHAEAGNIRYDVGVSEYSYFTNYSDFSLSADEVRALVGTYHGRYLYIKAHLLSNGQQDATLGAVSIGHQ